jgi:Restriction endonuclease
MVNIHTTAQQFEELVAGILEARGFLVNVRESRERERGYDFIVTFVQQRCAVEVKYYKTGRAQASLLELAASRLVWSSGREQVERSMLVVSCLIEPILRKGLEEKFGIVFVDRSDLYRWCSDRPEFLDRLAALLEADETTPPILVGRSVDEVLSMLIPTPRSLRVVDSTGTALCAELHSLKPGKDDWVLYEKVCEKILKYLFENDLKGWHRQKRTDDGFNRFDFVCRIHPATEFWRFLLHQLNSRYVLFEFKNYRDTIRQGQILTTEKYLLERGLRRVAIILTRLGCDAGARAMRQGAMREQGKLILVINDDQICDMLHMKENGEDPSDFLSELADDFLLTLPR